MEQFNKKINSQLLKVSQQYFTPSYIHKDNITKIDDELYSYWIGAAKMYVFDENDIIPFMIWYWHNVKDSFVVDICNINYDIQYKYFCDKIPNFKIIYPTVDEYNKNIIENSECINKFEEIINDSGGIYNFITDVIIFKNRYKTMGIKKTNNINYLFATNCGTQILRK
jgi:hypothetical protein